MNWFNNSKPEKQKPAKTDPKQLTTMVDNGKKYIVDLTGGRIEILAQVIRGVTGKTKSDMLPSERADPNKGELAYEVGGAYYVCVKVPPDQAVQLAKLYRSIQDFGKKKL